MNQTIVFPYANFPGFKNISDDYGIVIIIIDSERYFENYPEVCRGFESANEESDYRFIQKTWIREKSQYCVFFVNKKSDIKGFGYILGSGPKIANNQNVDDAQNELRINNRLSYITSAGQPFQHFDFRTQENDQHIGDAIKGLLPIIICPDYNIEFNDYLITNFRIRNLHNSQVFLLTENVINIKAARK